MDEALAAVGLDEAGGDLHQRRLARAIAADKAQAVARLDVEVRALEERRAAERQVNVAEGEKGCCHALLATRCSARRLPSKLIQQRGGGAAPDLQYVP